MAPSGPDRTAPSARQLCRPVPGDFSVPHLLAHTGPRRPPDRGYARGILSGVAELYEAPNDVDEAAAARMERSKIVHEPGHRFVMVIEEAVLKHQMGDSDAMAAQLGYLLTAGALPSVSLGIIPTTVQRTLWPQELFHVYDDQMVSVELMSARVRVTQPTEVALYVTAFERLRGMAVYGAEARA